MAFMLRVQLDCQDTEVASVMLESLTTMASLQDQHPGVICYNFARPDPDNRPNHLEFTEVYGNEATFWGHSSDPKFLEAYLKGFPKGKFDSVTYGYGPGMQGKIKEICTAVLQNCQYPADTCTAGVIVGSQTLNRTSSFADDGGVLLVGQIQAKDGKAQEILQLISKLSTEANEGVIVCFGSIANVEKEPNVIEVVQLCTTNSHLVAHFCSDQGKDVLKSILEASDSNKWNVYGTLLHTTSAKLSEVGVEAVARKTDAGYVLHPHADPAGQ